MKFLFGSLIVAFLGHVFYGIYLSAKNTHVYNSRGKNAPSENLEKADDYTKTYIFLGGKR